jgi:hypothetical protein
MSTMSEMSAIIVQLFTCVYRFDMKKRQVSTESGNEQKKCLVKWFFCNLVEKQI